MRAHANQIKIGASVVQGVEGVEHLPALKLGNLILAKIPVDFDQVIAARNHASAAKCTSCSANFCSAARTIY